jgi:uncharacterized membrane protein HdeD (DUF308 family)
MKHVSPYNVWNIREEIIMWKNMEVAYNYIFRVLLAVILILFMILVFLTLGNKELSPNAQVLTFISLLAVLFSLPGIVQTLADVYNPKKKKFKLTCECPNCKHLIHMSMVED